MCLYSNLNLLICFFQQDNIELAIAAAERWVKLEPGAEPGTGNLFHYYKLLSERNITYDSSDLPPLRNIQRRQGFHTTMEFKTYEKLCQGKAIPEVIFEYPVISSMDSVRQKCLIPICNQVDLI